MKRPQCLLLTTLTLRASIDTMFGDLADALRRQGVHTRVVADAPQAPNLPLVHGLVGELRDYDGPRFIIDNNAKSRLTAQGADGKPIFIHDVWNIPRLSIFESNPIHHLGQMAQLPRNAAMTVIDATHVEVLDAFGISRRAVEFMAHAGPPPLDDVLPIKERAIDVLFIGNVKDVPAPDTWVDALACPAETKPAVSRVIAQRWKLTGDGSMAMLRQALAETGVAPDPRRDLALNGAIELYVNNLKRRELLSAITGAKLTICGEVETKLPNAERVTVTGPVSFAKTLQLIDNAKLVLNTMPFRSGAHERIFSWAQPRRRGPVRFLAVDRRARGRTARRRGSISGRPGGARRRHRRAARSSARRCGRHRPPLVCAASHLGSPRAAASQADVAAVLSGYKPK